ncbi:hypothetical protein DPMN_188694 [Dreissena polymorpha]|uniref:Uncharacterized protein n=1 Tax=Dreissena polymorpha TaxID=45954 RepID=A0A9D4DSL3_DREPO|nr:hypothetical protein DPMN_188694 [Dreissena polymorpha]
MFDPGGAPVLVMGPCIVEIDRIVIRDIQYQLEVNRCRNEEFNFQGSSAYSVGGDRGQDGRTAEITTIFPCLSKSVGIKIECASNGVDNLPEEQIPRYRLRADTITDFTGYGHRDWIQTPVLPPIDDCDLTPELALDKEGKKPFRSDLKDLVKRPVGPVNKL